MNRGRPAAWLAPAMLVIASVAIFPLCWSFWESLRRHDLRLPWLGTSFVAMDNYREMFSDERFTGALLNTVLFTASTVTLEMTLGLGMALALHGAGRGRGLLRTATILPWALPTVVVGLLWRFLFDGESGALTIVVTAAGGSPPVWLADRWLAWVPVILADVWKTTPFVAILLLAGLQQIPRELYEAAAIDGAGPVRRFRAVTLPLLAPAVTVALVFRVLDAFRVFDLIYVLTGGGPGRATEPLALYTFNALFQNLRFGYGSALAIVSFVSAAMAGVVVMMAMRRAAR